jgi:hypothetical protein
MREKEKAREDSLFQLPAIGSIRVGDLDENFVHHVSGHHAIANADGCMGKGVDVVVINILLSKLSEHDVSFSLVSIKEDEICAKTKRKGPVIGPNPLDSLLNEDDLVVRLEGLQRIDVRLDLTLTCSIGGSLVRGFGDEDEGVTQSTTGGFKSVLGGFRGHCFPLMGVVIIDHEIYAKAKGKARFMGLILIDLDATYGM